MLRSWKISSAFGIPVFLHPSFLLLPLLVLVGQLGEEWVQILLLEALLLVVFSCVVLHEFGHALMARWFGIRCVDITLYPIGGVARLERLSRVPAEEVLIAIAGPAVNVAIAALLTPLWLGLAYLAYLRGEPGLGIERLQSPQAFLLAVWMSNLVLFLFNLLPTFPMDGGRVLRAVLSFWFGFYRATQIAVMTGRVLIVLGLGAVALFVPQVLLSNPMLLVVGGFVVVAGWRELHYIRRLKQRAEEAAREAEEEEEESVAVELMPDRPAQGYQNLLLRGAPTPDYSGFTWDEDRRVCVHWLNGQPIGVFFVPEGQRTR